MNKQKNNIILYLFILTIFFLSTQIKSLSQENSSNQQPSIEIQSPTIETEIKPTETVPQTNTESTIKDEKNDVEKQEQTYKNNDKTEIQQSVINSKILSKSVLPTGKYVIKFKGRYIDLKKYINFTTLLTITGLTATFFGLFSTWLIYHLNRKNNNPLVIDKHNSIIQYIDDLSHMKSFFILTNVKEDLENLQKAQTPDNISRAANSYESICKNISKIDLIKTHSKYEKHIKNKNITIFDSLIDAYKMIKIDGDYLSNNPDYHIIDTNCQSNPNNSGNITKKILSLLKFEEQIELILSILKKSIKI